MGSVGSYFNAYDWHGSMISIVLLFIVFIITWATKGFTEKEPERRQSMIKKYEWFMDWNCIAFMYSPILILAVYSFMDTPVIGGTGSFPCRTI